MISGDEKGLRKHSDTVPPVDLDDVKIYQFRVDKRLQSVAGFPEVIEARRDETSGGHVFIGRVTRRKRPTA